MHDTRSWTALVADWFAPSPTARCALLIEQASALLDEIDVVGTVEDGAGSLVRIANASRLQWLPSALFSNSGYKAQIQPVARRTQMEGARASAAMQFGDEWRRLNVCSERLYAIWRARTQSAPVAYNTSTRGPHERGGDWNRARALMQSAIEAGRELTSQPCR